MLGSGRRWLCQLWPLTGELVVVVGEGLAHIFGCPLPFHHTVKMQGTPGDSEMNVHEPGF